MRRYLKFYLMVIEHKEVLNYYEWSFLYQKNMETREKYDHHLRITIIVINISF